MIAVEEQKRAAAFAAVAEVEAGMLVGLGTGSTAAYAISALAERVEMGLAVRAVATSARIALAAQAAKIPVIDFADFAVADLCIDGVDEIDPEFRAIKGAGGAMLREKVVASAATRMIAIADATKQVARLGTKPLPVEVLPFARTFAASQIAALGGTCGLRHNAGGAPTQTDQGNHVLDCCFVPLPNPAELACALDRIPGIIGNGFFLDQIDALYVGMGSGVLRLERDLRRSPATPASTPGLND